MHTHTTPAPSTPDRSTCQTCGYTITRFRDRELWVHHGIDGAWRDNYGAHVPRPPDPDDDPRASYRRRIGGAR